MLPEFDRFATTLLSSGVSDDIKRICTIVHNHISDIAPLGTAHGQRSKKIIEFAQKEYNATSSAVATRKIAGPVAKFSLKRMERLEVESFRGFTEREPFDLDAPIVLLYGPNGTGKSSFFEALEFALLGSVEEAEARRFSTVTDYLKNARTQRYVRPVLRARNDKGDSVQVTADNSAYRFCFVRRTG